MVSNTMVVPLPSFVLELIITKAHIAKSKTATPNASPAMFYQTLSSE